VDISQDKTWPDDIKERVETSWFGPFVFQIGVDHREAAMLLQRIADAQARFLSSPLSQVANRLEQEVLVSSIFSTNTIEGGYAYGRRNESSARSRSRTGAGHGAATGRQHQDGL
jgi:hypothetical protein